MAAPRTSRRAAYYREVAESFKDEGAPGWLCEYHQLNRKADLCDLAAASGASEEDYKRWCASKLTAFQVKEHIAAGTERRIGMINCPGCGAWCH